MNQITRNQIKYKSQDTRNQQNPIIKSQNSLADAILMCIMRHPHPRVRHGAGFQFPD